MNRNKWNVRCCLGVLMEVFMEGIKRSFSCLKVKCKGHQIDYGPKPDPEIQRSTGLMGGSARCY